MFLLSVKAHFDSAHYLEAYDGPCKRTHGHTWKVQASWEAKDNQVILSGPKQGMIIDFKLAKKALNTVIEHLDHYLINEQVDVYPTAENLAVWFYDELMDVFSDTRLHQITLWESEDCMIQYSPYAKRS